MNNLPKETLSLPRRIFGAIGRWIHVPLNMIIVFCLVAGSLLMQIVAHQHIVNRGLILIFCAAFSVASVLFYTWKHSGAVELSLGVSCGAAALLVFNTVSASVKAYLANLLYCYGLISRLKFDRMSRDGDATLCFILIALIASMLIAAYLMRSGPIIMGLFFPLASLVLTIARHWDECEPAVTIAVMCALAVVLMTHRVRRIDAAAAGKQSLIVSVPTAAVLIVLALIISPEGYALPEWGVSARDTTNDILTNVFGIVQKQQEDYYEGTTGFYRTKINVDELGPRMDDERRVMQVYAEERSVIYLRAFSYMGYSEGTWRHENPTQAKDISGIIDHPLTVPENEEAANRKARIMIRTDEVDSMIFLPYTTARLPEGGACYGDSYVRNTANLQTYTLAYGSLTAVNPERNKEYEQLVYEYYLDIPEETAESLRAIAVENELITAAEAASGRPRNVDETVDKVIEFVKESAEYNPEPELVPEDKDFPVWFLTEAESGYCTHFASTATLMLRAIGVPARLTTGFVVRTEPYVWENVLGEDAYSWVEYYRTGAGEWAIEEPTPTYQPEVSGSDVSASDLSDINVPDFMLELILTSGSDVTSGADVPVASDADAASDDPADTATTTTDVSATTSSSDAAATTVSTTTVTTTTAPEATTTAAAPVTEPSAAEPADQTDETEPQTDKDTKGGSALGITIILAVVLLPVLTHMVLFAIRMNVNGKRQRSFKEGTANERASAMADYLEVLKEAGGGSWSAKVRTILLKAQFSEHELSSGELEQVKESVAQSLEAVKVNSNWFRSFANKYIRFIY